MIRPTSQNEPRLHILEEGEDMNKLEISLNDALSPLSGRSLDQLRIIYLEEFIKLSEKIDVEADRNLFADVIVKFINRDIIFIAPEALACEDMLHKKIDRISDWFENQFAHRPEGENTYEEIACLHLYTTRDIIIDRVDRWLSE